MVRLHGFKLGNEELPGSGRTALVSWINIRSQACWRVFEWVFLVKFVKQLELHTADELVVVLVDSAARVDGRKRGRLLDVSVLGLSVELAPPLSSHLDIQLVLLEEQHIARQLGVDGWSEMPNLIR